MQVQLETGEIRDVSISQVTQGNYICPKGEETFVHCKMEMKVYKMDANNDPVKTSKPFIQKFEPKWFAAVGFHELKQQGYSIEILFDPKRYAEERKEIEAEIAAGEAELRKQEAERAAAEAEEKRKADEERKAQERAEEKAKMKAEIIEELKASGVIPSEDKKEPKKK